jgi:hypothetical protein
LIPSISSRGTEYSYFSLGACFISKIITSLYYYGQIFLPGDVMQKIEPTLLR